MVIEIKVPDIGSDEVEVTDILVKIGDKIQAEQSLITVEGDKALMEIPAPFAGIVKELRVAIGDKVSTDSLIMIFEVNDNFISSMETQIEEKIKQPLTPISSLTTTTTESNLVQKGIYVRKNTSVHATPLIRRMANELGVNLVKIKGTGPKNRILKEDLEAYLNKSIKQSKETIYNEHNNTFLYPEEIEFSKFGKIEKISLGKIQKISGANLSRNWTMIPHVTLFEKTDITDLEAFRKKQKIEIEQSNKNIKLTLLVFIMKAVTAALQQIPRFNSSLCKDGKQLILKKYINIGIAVDTQNGLIVPVFKDVNKKNIIELSDELALTLKKARDGKLCASNMKGGCFTISNLGNLGTDYFTPIVNAPEVAILGVSKSIVQPVWNGKKFVPRLMMPMSLSFDHRVIDGADGVRFVKIIGNTLFDIRRLLM